MSAHWSASSRAIIGRSKKNSGHVGGVPITAKWGLVGRGQNAAYQSLSSAFWHDNSSAAGKDSEVGHDDDDASRATRDFEVSVRVP